MGEDGVRSEELLNIFEKHVNPGWARLNRLMGMVQVECEGEASMVRDASGTPFIDFSTGVSSLNMGHRHPRIIQAVRNQLDRLALSTRLLLNENQIRLADRLASLAPGDLEYCFFTHSGTEAVEGALKLARAATGRTDFIAAENAFHGKSMGALSASGRDSYKDPFRPLVPGFHHVPFGDAEAVEAALNENTAAVILEPIQGEAGVIVPPDDYLPRVRKACDANGTLLILDEVQTGLGRTGRNFCCEHWGVVPDIMTLAKSLGGGVMPLGAIVATERVFRIFGEHPWIHSTTTGGNPLATAAGIAALDVLVEERLAEQADAKGAWAMKRLAELSDRFPGVIREFRGKGLLIGIEFVDGSIGGLFLTELVEEKVIAIPALNDFRIMRFAPALNISDKLLEEGMKRVAIALERTAQLAEQLQS